MWPTHHIGMMTTRGESSCLRLLHNTLTLHCQSIKFQGHAELPSFLLSPSSFPYLLCLQHSTSKMLTCRRSAELSVQEDEVYVRLPLRQSRVLYCLSLELYTISPEPPGGRLFIEDECSQDTESTHMCMFCRERLKHFMIFSKEEKIYI